MESRPAMVENSFSKGVATEAAMVSGLAPESVAVTEMVGKSTVGRSATGRRRYPMTPARRIPNMIKMVATGRLMNRAETFMGRAWPLRPRPGDF